MIYKTSKEQKKSMKLKIGSLKRSGRLQTLVHSNQNKHVTVRERRKNNCQYQEEGHITSDSTDIEREIRKYQE